MKSLAILLLLSVTLSCDRADDQTSKTMSGPVIRVVGAVPVSVGVSDEGHSTATVVFDVPSTGTKVEPSVALSYYSGSQRPWTVSHPVITRCPSTLKDDGASSVVNFSASDRFCLGGKRLSLSAGSYGSAGSEYRTMPDEFSKIVYHGDRFLVYAKSGDILTFGDSASSREDDPLGRGAFSWHLTKREDRAGNFISYVMERPQSSTPRLSRIDYGGNSVFSMPTTRSIFFEYEPFQAPKLFRAGVSFEESGRLKYVKMKVKGSALFEYRLSWSGLFLSSITKCFPSGSCLRDTTFSYDTPEPALSQAPMQNAEVSPQASTAFDLQKSYRYFEDFDGDGKKDFLTVTKQGAYMARGQASGFSQAQPFTFDAQGFSGINKGSRGDPMYAVDADMDGYLDLLLFAFSLAPAQQGLYLAKGGPSGFAAFSLSSPASTNWNLTRHMPILADVDSDGLLDVAMLHEDGVILYQNAGNGSFTYNGVVLSDFGMKNGWNLSSHPRYLFDVNADGYVDVVGFHDTGVKVSLGSERGFSPSSQWSPDFGSRQGYTADTPRYLVDVNGDFLPDIVAFAKTGIIVALNTGVAFSAPEQWSANLGFDQGFGASTSQRLFLDYDADGLLDFVGVTASGVTVLKNEGRPTSAAVVTHALNLPSWAPSMSFVTPVDFGGNGVEDLVVMTRSGLVPVLSAAGIGLLKTTSDGYGNRHEFSYKPQSDPSIYQRGVARAFPYFHLSGSRPLVSSLRKVPFGAPSSLVEYVYTGSMAHVNRGFLGFEKTQSKDGPIVTITERSDGVAASEGAITRVTTYANGVAVSSQVNTWRRKATSGSHFFFADTSTETVYDLKTGKQLHTTVKSEDYDGLGNLVSSTTRITDAFESRVSSLVNEYEDDVSSWSIGRLKKSTVSKWSGLPTDTPFSGGVSKKVSSFDYYSNGQLKSATTEPGTPFESTETFGRIKNKWGLVDTITRSWVSPAVPAWARGADASAKSVQEVTRVFDDSGFSKEEENALGHQTSSETGPFGIVESFTDQNGIEEKSILNEQGQVRLKESPGNPSLSISYSFCDSSCPLSAAYKTTTSSTAGGATVSYFNGRSEEVRREVKGFKGLWSVVDTEYDEKSRVSRQSQAYFKGETPNFTSFEYDAIGRRTKVHLPDNTSITTDYSGYEVTVTDADGVWTKKTYAASGNLCFAEDSNGKVLSHEYGPDGLLSKVFWEKGTIRYAYDALGRKIYESDPDRGVTEYVYGGNGLPMASKDANGSVTLSFYDELGRVTSRKHSSGRTESFAYDAAENGVGLLSSDAADEVSRSYNYDRMSRIDTVSVVMPQRSYSFGHTYDSLGRLSSRTFPKVGKVDFRYDEFGVYYKTEKAGKTLREVKDIHPDGSIKVEALANGLSNRVGRNQVTGRIESISVDSASGLLDAETYGYSPAGRLSSRGRMSKPSDSFGYDSLGRLSSVTESGVTKQKVDIDPFGRLTRLGDQVNVYGTPTCSSASPVNGPSGAGYCYDARGQVIRKGSLSITYNEAGQPLSISEPGKTTAFSYDAMGHLAISGNEYSPMEGYSEDLTSGVVTAEVDTGVILKSSGEEAFLHRDRLGSAMAISDSFARITKLYYDPFGKVSQSVAVTDKLFTGQKQLPSGLVHMKGRLYDPATGVFLSPDPFVQDLESLQSVNRYAYMMGSPLSGTDPSGYLSMKSVGKSLNDGWRGISRAGKRLSDWMSKDQNQRLIAQVAVSVATAWACAPYSIYAWQLYAYSATGGAVSAAIGSKGNPEAIAKGALTAVAFAAVGNYFKTYTGPYRQVLSPIAHGVAGAASAAAKGGNAQEGFVSAFASSAIGHIQIAAGMKAVPEHFSDYAYNAAVAAITGGLSSEFAGGTFESGATTASFQRLFGDVMNTKFPPQPTRSLTSDEIARVKDAYQALHGRSDGVDFSKVSIIKGKFLPWQMDNVAITPDGNIYFPNENGNMISGVHLFYLIHEMQHVWQYQNGVNVLMEALPLQVVYWATARLVDVYSLPPNATYNDLNVEQQGDLAWEKYKEYLRQGTSRR